jgi:uncharacterized protein (DUF362 family)
LTLLDNSTVAIHHTLGDAHYPLQPPFHPPQAFPEYPFSPEVLDKTNTVYTAVREIFRLLQLDPANQDKKQWNPLGNLIQPGDRVLIKPNLVKHVNGLGYDPHSVVTHGSVIRVVLDYVTLAMRGEGTILIGDAPLQGADIAQVLRVTGLEDVLSFYTSQPGIHIEFADFRCERAITEGRMVLQREELAGAPGGYQPVNLGPLSCLTEISHRYHRFRVTDYDHLSMITHHTQQVHEYLIPRAVLLSNVVINLPKLKTHRKVGATLSLKNLVGINGHKDWLPHHTNLSIKEDGDEYLYPSWRKRLDTRLDEKIDSYRSRLGKYALRAGRKVLKLSGKLAHFPDPYFEGSWWGNDTLWRTVLDLNRILFYVDSHGNMTDKIQRRYLSLMDGFLAGEGEGPLEPTPRPCGLIICGFNPAVVDSVCARGMGFDPQKIPLIRQALATDWLTPPDQNIQIVTNEPRWKSVLTWKREDSLAFSPSRGWLGHIELE